ncbi:MAG: hypothetical protein ACREGR_01565, partial [Minisyncoccia bacterium]
DKATSDLFAVNRAQKVSGEEWLRVRFENPEEIVEIQNRESRALWPSVISFCNTFAEDGEKHIIEGVGLIPSLVARMEGRPRHMVWVGDAEKGHAEAMIRHALENPQQDWLGADGFTREKIEAMANFVRAMSRYFESEAGKYSLPYIELDHDNFDESAERVIEFLMLS